MAVFSSPPKARLADAVNNFGKPEISQVNISENQKISFQPL
jgi:hypothetical protein